MADVALAGRVIASHYAGPVQRLLRTAAALRDAPTAEGEDLHKLRPGEPFLMLDESLGWAWGYAGKERRVGYLPSSALAVQPSTEA